MLFQNCHITDQIDRVELTPPTSCTVARQEARRLTLLIALIALLLSLCALSFSHLDSLVQTVGAFHAFSLRSFFVL